jgi:hypothetical protein
MRALPTVPLSLPKEAGVARLAFGGLNEDAHQSVGGGNRRPTHAKNLELAEGTEEILVKLGLVELKIHEQLDAIWDLHSLLLGVSASRRISVRAGAAILPLGRPWHWLLFAALEGQYGELPGVILKV